MKPKDDDRGEWTFMCGMCFNAVDEDHCYCHECGDHSGEWMLIDDEGNEVYDTDTSNA